MVVSVICVVSLEDAIVKSVKKCVDKKSCADDVDSSVEDGRKRVDAELESN